MNKWSLQLLIPSICLNNCIYCISKLNNTQKQYTNLLKNWFENTEINNLYLMKMKKSLDEWYNSIIITSDWEPILNVWFLKFLWNLISQNNIVVNNLEIQTSWVWMKDYHIKLLKNIWVTLVSLSLSNIFDNEINGFYNQTRQWLTLDIDKICADLVSNWFKLRLSLNMTNSYNQISPKQIIERAKLLGCNELTFRRLYPWSKENSGYQNIIENSMADEKQNEILNYLEDNCEKKVKLGELEKIYYLSWISVMYITDCMGQNSYRYRILKPNCRLYKSWEEDAKPID